MKKNCIVIGSGLAGSLVANQLSSDFSVSVLEIGPQDSIRYPEVNYTNKELAHVATFCHGSGGGTNLWHNGLLPIQPADVSYSMFRRVLQESRQFMDQAASLLHFEPTSFRDEFNCVSADVAKHSESIGDCSDGVDSLLYPKNFAPLNLDSTIDSYYDVSNIQFIADGRKVTELTFSAAGTAHRVRTDYVVVSCGTLGTPGVLSNLLQTLGQATAPVGSGFIDHPMGFIGKFRFPKSIAESVRKFALLDRGSYESRNVIRLRSDCGQYTACAFFRPSVTMQNDLSRYKYKSFLGISRGMERLRAALSPRILHPDILAEIVSHVTPFNVPTRTYSVLFIGEQRRAKNRVYVDGDRLTVDWSISESEIAIYNQMIKRLQTMLIDSAEESVVQSELTPDWLWSAAHHSGTTPMGAADCDIIDENLQVKATDNVFACDGSVIQEHSYANTGLTIGQLALRLAHLLCTA